MFRIRTGLGYPFRKMRLELEVNMLYGLGLERCVYSVEIAGP